MTGVGDYLQFGLRPCIVQRKGLVDGTDHVITTVHDHAWNVRQSWRVAYDLVGRKKGIVHEVMAFDARQAERRARCVEMLDDTVRWLQCRRAAFPQGPGFGGGHTRHFIVTGEALVIGCHHVATLRRRNGAQVIFPVVRKHVARTLLIKPVDVTRPAQKDAAQDQTEHALRMRLRINKCQR